MTVDELIAALTVPRAALVGERVPKKLLIENGAPTSADKRQINDGIEALQWVAALKPATIAVPEYRDAVREYLEIAVLRLTLRAGAKETRLIELVHRAVPYPVMLLTEKAQKPLKTSLSLAHKRRSEADAEATVLDDEIVAVDWPALRRVRGDSPDERRDVTNAEAFLSALAINARPRASLHALYGGWIDVAVALRIARETGVFSLPENPERAELRRQALAECGRLEAAMTSIRAAAAKEKQIARQVDLNLELQRLRAAYAEARAAL